jgi:hypothetical protein
MLSKDYILGFVEGEGCFSIAISKNIDRKPRANPAKRNEIKNPHLFIVKPSFRVTNCEANRAVLDEIRETLGFGSVYVQKRADSKIQNLAHFYTKSFTECLRARDFFKELSFRTKKGEDFAIWCKCLEIMEQKRHHAKEGILEICALRDQMNFRKTKKKWSKEEIGKILEEKPIHQTAHFDQNQARLIHNNFDIGSWLELKKGNNKVAIATN